MTQRRRVTQGEFEAIECNRCGACCEPLWLPSPLLLVEAAASPLPAGAAPERAVEHERFVAWLHVLQPTGRVEADAKPGATHEYHCGRLQRDAYGLSFCTAYEDRPSVCRDFPYGKPVNPEEYPDCSWNVDIFSLEVGQTYQSTAGRPYELLWRAGPSLYVRFGDGSEATLDAETETRFVRDRLESVEGR
jgi:Fe-S-cluster containining protein